MVDTLALCWSFLVCIPKQKVNLICNTTLDFNKNTYRFYLAISALYYAVCIIFIWFLQAFSIVIVSYTVELTYVQPTNNDFDIVASNLICYENPHTMSSGHRICHNGVAAAVSSILVCIILLIIDAFIPCVHDKVCVLENTKCLKCIYIIPSNYILSMYNNYVYYSSMDHSVILFLTLTLKATQSMYNYKCTKKLGIFN